MEQSAGILLWCYSRIFFYSHNSAGLNRYRCKGQTVVNLWHGCGYKDAELGKKKQNIKPDFDYALVPGPVFVKTKSGLWNCNRQAVNDGISQI